MNALMQAVERLANMEYLKCFPPAPPRLDPWSVDQEI